MNTHKIQISAPLIFVPGFMGSQLWDADNIAKRIWPFWHWNEGKLKFESINLFVVDISYKIANGLFPDVYAGLNFALESMGYVLNKNFWNFHYDWTQSNEISAKRLSEFINENIKSKWNQIDIISHSMGGIVTRAAQKLFKAPIRRIVYLASPHFGAPKAYFALHPDIKWEFFSYWLLNLMGNALWKRYMRIRGDQSSLMDQLKMLSTQLQSIYELLPDHSYLTSKQHIVIMNKGESPDFKSFPIDSVNTLYYNNSISSFRDDKQLRSVDRAMKFKAKLGDKLYGNNLIVYSNSEMTFDRVEYYLNVKRK